MLRSAEANFVDSKFLCSGMAALSHRVACDCLAAVDLLKGPPGHNALGSLACCAALASAASQC